MRNFKIFSHFLCLQIICHTARLPTKHQILVILLLNTWVLWVGGRARRGTVSLWRFFLCGIEEREGSPRSGVEECGGYHIPAGAGLKAESKFTPFKKPTKLCSLLFPSTWNDCSFCPILSPYPELSSSLLTVLPPGICGHSSLP